MGEMDSRWKNMTITRDAQQDEFNGKNSYPTQDIVITDPKINNITKKKKE